MIIGLTWRLTPPLLTHGAECGPICPIMKWWHTFMSQFGVPLLGIGRGIPGHHTALHAIPLHTAIG